MDDQLVLIESSRDWKLDRRTVERGRRGVALARAALRAAAHGVVGDQADPAATGRAA